MIYKEYLKSEDWLKKRSLKRLRSKSCAICNSTKQLDTHHLNYRNLYDVEQSDLRVLCRRCHFLAHDLYNSGVFSFKSTSHQSRFAILKHNVKKSLGITNKNMFVEKK